MKKYKSENHGDKTTGIKKKARLALQSDSSDYQPSDQAESMDEHDNMIQEDAAAASGSIRSEDEEDNDDHLVQAKDISPLKTLRP